MDDGELDFSNQVFSTPDAFLNSTGEIATSSRSIDSFLDEIFRDAQCTHTHTCNPPGPDSSHTHTCFHVHTKIVPALGEDDKADGDSAESTEKKRPASKKQPLGNREAVRKYREKKKARTASLEDEAVRLRAMNQMLLKRLQGQAVLEAEIGRLKCLLVDIRGRIEGEIGSFPYRKPSNMGNSMPLSGGAYMMNPCNVQCGGQIYCLHPEEKNGNSVDVERQVSAGCEFESHCLANQNNIHYGLKEATDCGVAGVGDGAFNSSSSDDWNNKGDEV
ncbi:hypothetical protein SAY87_002719 [Trapa incisa]|uniref:BZIP domain-containing protein n=1 Tax=Trapa incisa TaxID=236973 RepID=A0AAN7JXH8_9MYRT|nr:hypothetical protein SAY87_002719 [Trapa incisa]